jgi:hypothetical protein
MANQKLSPALENSIVHWILWERRNNRPPTKEKVRQYAQHVCDVSGLATKIGNNWVDRFIPRHPEILEPGPSGSQPQWKRGKRRPNRVRGEAETEAEDSGQVAEQPMPPSRPEDASEP